MSTIKVVVVDDSAVIRKLVTEILDSDPEIEVVGSAANAFIARDKIKALNPDVITLDVEMPKMDGITFLKNLMRLRPMPVVMLSTLTQKGADITLEALSVGALDFVFKPTGSGEGLDQCAAELIEKVKTASKANVKHRVKSDLSFSKGSGLNAKFSADSIREDLRLIALGASTGGTEAIREVLFRLPEYAPPIVIAQHIPKEFSGPFAKRMDSISAMDVKEAEDGDLIKPGHVYIAPGSHHLTIERYGPSRMRCRLDLNEPVNRHRPSVDVLFDSVAKEIGGDTLCVLLTGMGKDGAMGMKRMQQVGSQTIAQDETSSVVWGMPGEAVKLGAADYVCPLDKVAEQIMKLSCSPKRSVRVA